jgi:hypothetical protein
MKSGSGWKRVRLGRTVVAAMVLAGCTHETAVSATMADGADVSKYHTFSMMTVPANAVTAQQANGALSTDTLASNSGQFATPASDTSSARDTGAKAQMDPMLASSPVGQAIRSDLVHSFSSKGYSESSAPDFLVAFYAGTGQIVDTKAYPYGYTGLSNTGKVDVRVYPAGTVIVDVVDGNTKQLIWRGLGVTTIPNDPAMYSRQLASTVNAIVAQFPKAPKKA